MQFHCFLLLQFSGVLYDGGYDLAVMSHDKLGRGGGSFFLKILVDKKKYFQDLQIIS